MTLSAKRKKKSTASPAGFTWHAVSSIRYASVQVAHRTVKEGDQRCNERVQQSQHGDLIVLGNIPTENDADGIRQRETGYDGVQLLKMPDATLLLFQKAGHLTGCRSVPLLP